MSVFHNIFNLILRIPTQVYIAICTYAASQYLDSENSTHRFVCLMMFSFSQGLLFTTLMYIKWQISAVNDQQIVKYVKTEANMTWDEMMDKRADEEAQERAIAEEEEKRKASGVKATQKKIKSKEKKEKITEQTAADYDAQYHRNNFNQKLLYPCMITLALFHWKKMILPLAIQSIMMPYSFWSFELFQIYVRGKTAKEIGGRPFASDLTSPGEWLKNMFTSKKKRN